MTSKLTFKSRDGLSIEGEIDEPFGPHASLVLCHPHPKMGGTLNAPLLLALRDEMLQRGWRVLRFNFRGIGKSEGESATGTNEVNDALGALDAIPTDAPIAIAGWSFGGAVGVRAAAQSDVAACVALAPSVDARPHITEGIPPNVDPKCPVLIVVGSNDQHVSPKRAEEWAADHGATFISMPGANHFFWAKYEDLAKIVAEWLEQNV